MLPIQQVSVRKVRTFWETHKIWKIFLMRKIAQIFVCFQKILEKYWKMALKNYFYKIMKNTKSQNFHAVVVFPHLDLDFFV